MKQNIIAVDFDGTLCENKWPEIGMPNEELIEYLKKRQTNGEKLILWTSRNEEQTQDAVEWCKKYGLIFDAVNDNLPEIGKQSVNRFEGMIIELDFWKRWQMLIFAWNSLSPFLILHQKSCRKLWMLNYKEKGTNRDE